MGRKDASATHMTPVESYRKHIGKQDNKKAKKDAKERKRQIDQKRSAMSIQEIILVAGAVIALLAGLYVLLLWNVGTAADDDVTMFD